MIVMEKFNAYVAANKDRFLNEFFDLLRIPSVAAQGRGITEATRMVQQRLEQIGAAVQIIQIDQGSPVIYATIGSGTRTLLIYDHYDVQPEDPLELWTSQPFEPIIRDGKVYARGASDNKSNLMLRIQAIETWLATKGELPLNIAFVIEGEEEIGSPTLPRFCRDYADLLKADGCLWETGGVSFNDQPTVQCGAKGLQYVELVARGASSDLHSSFAPNVVNPAWRLVWALATMKATDERVLIPGFYDAVRPPSEADMKALESIPDQDEELLQNFGVSSFLGGARGVERLRRLLFEPTCTICGIVSGYTGQGAKTVLPSEARVKIDFRLVPDMEPQTVLQQLRAHLDAHGFEDVAVVPFAGEHPARSDLNAPIVQAVVAAAEATYQKPVILSPTMAGTGPMHMLCQQFGTPACSGAGTSYPGEQIHAPDENIRLDDYWKAFEWMGRIIETFGA